MIKPLLALLKHAGTGMAVSVVDRLLIRRVPVNPKPLPEPATVMAKLTDVADRPALDDTGSTAPAGLPANRASGPLRPLLTLLLSSAVILMTLATLAILWRSGSPVDAAQWFELIKLLIVWCATL